MPTLLERLPNYGWAILIVVVVLVALYYSLPPVSEDEKTYCQALMTKLEGDSFTAYNKGCRVCWNKTLDVYEIGNRKYVEEFDVEDLCKTFEVLE